MHTKKASNIRESTTVDKIFRGSTAVPKNKDGGAHTKKRGKAHDIYTMYT